MKNAIKELLNRSNTVKRRVLEETTSSMGINSMDNKATTSSPYQVHGGHHYAANQQAVAQSAADTEHGALDIGRQQQASMNASQLQQQQQESESSVIAVADHCPAAMLKDVWSLQAFELRDKLYAGHISSVYRAVDKKSGITVGLKLYKRTMLNDMERHQIAREIWLHIQLNHPSVIALYAAWKDQDYIYMVLEWAPEGNVFTFLQQSGGRLPESVVVPMILEPTMSALHYIHELGMIHRDVKPENILLTTSYQIKLADFGLSIHSSYEVANTRLGTIDYLSPEILDCPVKQHPQDHKQDPQRWYSSKVDVWSIGVLAYELLLGCTPFEAQTPQETLYKIKTQEVVYPTHELSAGAADFIRAALVRSPEQRASLMDLLQHPWLLKHKHRPMGGPHMRGRTQTQSEVAVHCFGSFGSEARMLASHACVGNPKLAHSFGSADGAHNNSCPQVLHHQLSAPAGQLQHAAGEAYHTTPYHQPSPLSKLAATSAAGMAFGQDPAATVAGHYGTAAPALAAMYSNQAACGSQTAGYRPGDLMQQQEQLSSGFVSTRTQRIDVDGQ